VGELSSLGPDRRVGPEAMGADRNFAGLVDAACAREADRPALLQGDQPISYDQLARRIQAFAEALRRQGAGCGRTVAIWLPNCPAFVEAFFGALRVGATVAPMGALLRPREVRERLRVIGSAVLVTTPALADALGAVDDVSVLRVDPSGGAFPDGRREAPVQRAADDVAVLIFTSGTTGNAKAAELTHAGLAWNVRAFIDAFALGRDDVQLAVPPLSHVMGMTCVMNATLLSGGALVMVERFDSAAVLALMAETGTTIAVGAPTMFVALVREAQKAARVPRLRLAHGGGSPFTEEIANAVEQTFGCRAREGYGMSEVGGAIAVAPLDGERRPGAVGRALAGSELRIVDVAGGGPLPVGQRGEVQVRSPSVMRGYRGDLATTRTAIDPDGWLSTGDIGYLDDAGYLFLVDRKKELIIRSGYNVYPREVEDVIMGYPGVLEVAVVGVPDDVHGQEVVALVVPTGPGSVDAAALKAFARDRLASYKYPRHILLVDALPKGPTGKIAKRQIDGAALLAQLPPA
jgi:long-chain acyl-CoA synthetase